VEVWRSIRVSAAVSMLKCCGAVKLHRTYLIYRQVFGCNQILRAFYNGLLRPHAWLTRPRLLQHSNDFVVDGRVVTVLVISGTTLITEYYSVV
jgi:hypothetical protein